MESALLGRPSANTEDDIRAVVRRVFKKAPALAIQKIVGYALLSKRDLSAVGDIACEVRAMLGTNDLSATTEQLVLRAIHEFLIPSDEAFLEGMAAVRAAGRKPARRPSRPAPENIEPAPTPAPGGERLATIRRGGAVALEAPERGRIDPALTAA